MAIAATTALVWGAGLSARGVSIVGTVPQGLPRLTLPPLDPGLWKTLLVPALLISIVGYVESISVALTLAAKRRQRVDPDQELIALGAANVGAAVSGGFPVTGGFARSVVNFEAGAETPAAGAFTAVGHRARHDVPDAAALLPAQRDAGRHHHRGGPVAGGPRCAQADLGLLPRRLRGHGRHHPRHAGRRASRRGWWWAWPSPSSSTSTPRRGRTWRWWASCPGTTQLPQRGPARRGDQPGDPVAAGGREPLLPERPIPRGPDQRCGGRESRHPSRHPRVSGSERHRLLGAREPRGRPSAAPGWRGDAPPVRSEGPGPGPTEAVALRCGDDREGPPVPVRRSLEHRPRPGAADARGAAGGQRGRTDGRRRAAPRVAAPNPRYRRRSRTWPREAFRHRAAGLERGVLHELSAGVREQRRPGARAGPGRSTRRSA